MPSGFPAAKQHSQQVRAAFLGTYFWAGPSCVLYQRDSVSAAESASHPSLYPNASDTCVVANGSFKSNVVLFWTADINGMWIIFSLSLHLPHHSPLIISHNHSPQFPHHRAGGTGVQRERKGGPPCTLHERRSWSMPGRLSPSRRIVGPASDRDIILLLLMPTFW